MLRCRRCRKAIIDSTCLSMVEATDDSSAAVCSIWHMDVDTLPEWILASVHQAQWTVGKLNCQNCGARLGGFNFINRSECPCGRDAAVHLNKSRVDRDHRHYDLIVQPGRTRPEKERAGTPEQNRDQRPEFNRTPLDDVQLNCAAVASHLSPAEASNPPTDRENPQSFSFSPLYCISHRRRCSLEDDSAFGACFCPVSPAVKCAVESTGTGTHGSKRSPVPHLTSQRFDTDGEASVGAVAGRRIVSGRTRRSRLGGQLLQASEEVESSPETTAVHQEVSASSRLFHRGRSVSDSAAEQDQEVWPEALVASPASNRLSKREKNRLKSLRRKQRRRERWLLSQLEQAGSVSGSHMDSEEEEDREGLTCAVCLELYFSPYSCQPCGHVFCEPCLRTIAKNRPTNTPCPLCRALISHTNPHHELNENAKAFFPKVYYARKQNFQSAFCAKWPLPSCRKRFRTFWGEPRQAAAARRRWHLVHGFTLNALDFNDVRGLVIVYTHSVNWILASLFLCFLIYYFFF
ncbi:E3 ubiquitin-protein ligase RNF180 isoform X1 [Etheostoma spectabile]|uniref:E3 ubiquitin-protein ligase RNF180 isoform X1 n=1 Tax=Etheostoma spectabile TaxID=54343 RepID=UPI0013AFB039|nr:E3 ubiquitin-protein ligase RNF180-like isoform X1 [Etheostoma spectabile]XP_032395305.1 E3 ubiquitin-protein ligase RNF180-like isoform X1 [Etheostoma spectabile]